MKEREAYYITVNRQAVKVSREIYEEYYRGERKEKYFLHDLKEQK